MWDDHRLLNLLASALFALAAALSLYAALLLVIRLPVFPLRAVEVNGRIAHTTREQVHAIVAGQLAGNFFTLDLEATRAAFQKLPWVRRANLRRRWPDRLEVQVEEHVALARWGDRGLVNTYGELFEAATNEVLPIFVAPEGSAAEVAQRYEVFCNALRALDKRPVRVFVSARRAWEIKLDDGKILELGRTAMEERVRRFVAVYARVLTQLPDGPYRIDLRYPNGFALRAATPAVFVRGA